MCDTARPAVRSPSGLAARGRANGGNRCRRAGDALADIPRPPSADNAGSADGRRPRRHSLRRAAVDARTRPERCPSRRSGRRPGGIFGRKIQPDAARHAPPALQRMRILRRRRPSRPRTSTVGASQGNTRGSSSASAGAPLGHVRPQHMPERRRATRGRTSVVNGPPPRSPTRLPAPPAGAQDWNVKRAIAAAARPDCDTAAMDQQVGVVTLGLLARRLDQQAARSVRVGDKIFKVLKETRSVAVQRKGMRERRERRVQLAGAGGVPHIPAMHRGPRAGRAVASRPISNSSVAMRKSGRGQSMAMTGSSAMASVSCAGRIVAAPGLQPADRQPRISQEIEHGHTLPLDGADAVGPGPLMSQSL